MISKQILLINRVSLGKTPPLKQQGLDILRPVKWLARVQDKCHHTVSDW